MSRFRKIKVKKEKFRKELWYELTDKAYRFLRAEEKALLRSLPKPRRKDPKTEFVKPV